MCIFRHSSFSHISINWIIKKFTGDRVNLGYRYVVSMYYIYVRLESLPASTLNIVWIGHGGGPLNVEYNLEHIVHFYIVFKNSIIIILLTWNLFVNNFYEFRDNWIFVTWQKLHILLKISSQWKGNLVVASYVEIGEREIVSPYLKFFAPKVAFLPK